MRRILKKDAIPSCFPHLPSYMTVNLSQPRASTSSAEYRQQIEKEREEKKKREAEERDKIQSFEHLSANLNLIVVPENVFVRHKSDSITFVSVGEEPIEVEYFLSVKSDLDFSMCVQNISVSKHKVAGICGNIIQTFSTLSKLLDFLKHMAETKDKTIVLKILSDFLNDIAQNETDPVLQKKLLFVSEQLSLALIPKMARKYSSDLLAAALMWKTTSSALYRQFLQEDCLTLPSFDYLTRLSRALTTETGLSESTLSYLKARFLKLTEKEKYVVLMLDEIYCAERAEYAGGTFYGGGTEACKTMLSFMVKSVAGKYSDIVALFPIQNLDSGKILSHFDVVMNSLTQLGYHVFAISVDNASPNRKFYVEELCAGTLSTQIPHPTLEGDELFLLFDSVHNFKNVYNNFVSRKVFVYPAIADSNPDGTKPPEKQAEFSHIEQLYNLEMGKPVKLAYKLNDKVLHPSNIEKTNVQLADSLFHESTIAGLRFYASTDYPEWANTANFLYVIRSWWNILNVKVPNLGIRKRNKYMKPVSNENLSNLAYLKTFSSWLEAWRDYSKTMGVKTSLTDETFLATIQTTKASIEVAEKLLSLDGMRYVLLGNLQSDPIERRFGWYRQLSGGNYFISVRQILEAEKSIRLKSLLKFSKLSMTEVKEAFEDGNAKQSEATQEHIERLLQIIDHDCTDFSPVQVEDANIVFYVAGCYARSLCKQQKCQSCVQLLRKHDDVPNISFECDRDMKYGAEKQNFLEQVNRGGLCYPSDLTYMTCLHAWKFYHDIQSQKEAFNFLLSSAQPVVIFAKTFITTCSQASQTQSIIQQQCEDGHPFSKLFERLAIKMFNTFAKNICAERNSLIHKGKKRSSLSKDGRKIKKLQCE